MNITAKEIAAKLGISTSSVSLAMNGKPGVSDATRARVMEEARKLGYSVSKAGEGRAGGSIRYVIFIEAGDTVKETSFYSIILKGIEKKAKEYGYNTIVSYFYSNGDWTGQIADICKDVEGVIILATEMTDAHIEKAYAHGLKDQAIPLALVDNATSLVNVDCVVNDALRGAHQAVTYLLEKGHPDVGYLRSASRIDNFDERQAGVVKARREYGVKDTAPLHTIEVGIASETAYQDMCRWLDRGGKPISAYFADNDIIAAGCIRALKSRGWRVPEDISIVGFDDMPICTMIDPALTTIRVMIESMGVLAMKNLQYRIEGGKAALDEGRDGVYRTTISTQLIERDSVVAYNSR